jgi:hypothetical protein
VLNNFPAQIVDGKTMVIVGQGDADICMYPMSEKVRQDGNTQLNIAFVAYQDPNSEKGEAMNAKESWANRVSKDQIAPFFENWVRIIAHFRGGHPLIL